jgi:hypothetical protein
VTKVVEHQVEVPVVHEVVKPCLTEAPEALPPVPAPTTCQEGFVCYTVEDALQLADNVNTLLERVHNDWTACGKPAP